MGGFFTLLGLTRGGFFLRLELGVFASCCVIQMKSKAKMSVACGAQLFQGSGVRPPAFLCACLMPVARWTKTCQQVCDVYESGSATMGAGSAKQFAKSHSCAEGMLRNAGSSAFSAAVIGKLHSVLVGDRQRPVSLMVCRAVLQMRLPRFRLFCVLDAAKCLEVEVQGLSTPQRIDMPPNEPQGLKQWIARASGESGKPVLLPSAQALFRCRDSRNGTGSAPHAEVVEPRVGVDVSCASREPSRIGRDDPT